MRIAALWKHEENGERWTSGEISADAGINLPAGAKLLCKIVKNEKKQAGDKLPDFYLEAWYPRPQERPADEHPASSPADDVPF